MKPNNINPIHFFSTHMKALDFHKASTLCNEFITHRFTTQEHQTKIKVWHPSHDYMFPTKCCYNIDSHVPFHPMLHHKTQNKKITRCKHSNEVILLAFECAHLDCFIFNGTFHKLRSSFTREEEFKKFRALITNKKIKTWNGNLMVPLNGDY
jgi:hypothetical protein